MIRPVRGLPLLCIAFLGCAAMLYAVIGGGPRGDWPGSWPRELEPLRESAYSIHSQASDLSESMYEIRFDRSDDFEKAWPHILSLKTSGAPLTLLSIGGDSRNVIGSMVVCGSPSVRVYTTGREYLNRLPSEDQITTESLAMLPRRPPAYLTIRPEDERWAAVIGNEEKTPRPRIRYSTELELIVDSEVIDLNRIRLPSDTPIIDRRDLR